MKSFKLVLLFLLLLRPNLAYADGLGGLGVLAIFEIPLQIIVSIILTIPLAVVWSLILLALKKKNKLSDSLLTKNLVFMGGVCWSVAIVVFIAILKN